MLWFKTKSLQTGIFIGNKKANLLEAKAMYPEMNFLSRYSMKWLWVASRAGFWIFNARMSNWFKKISKQSIFKHGMGPL